MYREIPYLLHTVAVNSGKTLPSSVGTVGRWFGGTPLGVFLTFLSSYTGPAFSTVLKDPNTDVELSGSSSIVQYLKVCQGGEELIAEEVAWDRIEGERVGLGRGIG